MGLRELMDDDLEDFMDDTEDGMALIDSAINELGVSVIQSTTPDFSPSPNDILISEQDATEAMAFIDSLDIESLGLKDGEARTYLLPEAEPRTLFEIPSGSFHVFVADVGRQSQAKPWSKNFLLSLGVATQEMFKNVAVRLRTGATEATHTLILAGRAKDLGLARKAFSDAMTMAGFDVSWRGYFRSNEKAAATSVEDKLASYGFSFEGTTLTFKAIAEIPSQHRAEAAKVVLSTLAEDLSSLNLVVESVRDEMCQRKEYAKVKRLREMHDITEEGLYYLLTKLENTSKLDPKGDILPLLQANREFMALAEDRVKLFSRAIEVTVNEAKRNGVAPEQIMTIIEKNGLTLKAAGQPALKLIADQAPVQSGKITELRAPQA